MQSAVLLSVIALSLAAAAGLAQAKSPAEWQHLSQQTQLTLPQAAEKALQAHPGQVVEASLDDGDGAGARYEVDIVDHAGVQHEVWVNASTGQTLLHKTDGPAKRKTLHRLQDAQLNLQQAVQAATAHTPGTVVKAELDSHWGTTSYEVDVLQANGHLQEIQLDAATGKILRTQRDH